MLLNKKASNYCLIKIYQYKFVIISAFIWGIIAHGFMIFNKISFHDDAFCLYSVGQRYGLGRWMLALLGNLWMWIFGGTNYSIPVFAGIISIGLIAVSCCLICEMFKIKSHLVQIIVSGLFVSCPVITALFGFMFTAPYYMIALLMSILSAWTLSKHKYDKRYSILGILILCCTIGIYQSYLAVTLSLLLSLMIIELFEENIQWKDFLKKGFYYIFCSGFALILYLIINKIVLKALNYSLVEYDGMSRLGYEGIGTYFYRVYTAYKELIFPSMHVSRIIFPGLSKLAYILIAFSGISFIALSLYTAFKRNKRTAFQLLFLIVIMPIAVNFEYIVANENNLTTLTEYSFYIPMVLLLAFLDRKKEICERRTFTKILTNIVLISTIFIDIFYCRYSNTCYFKAELMQEQAISYFTELKTRIEQMDGYHSDYPVAYINSGSKSLANINEMSNFNGLIYPYDSNNMINEYSWIQFMENWTGYAPTRVDDISVFEEMDEVKEMPEYPDCGSIKIIQNTIVVKF